MLMVLTRLGTDSKMIVTGDSTQVDLPDNVQSGLIDAMDKLAEISGIAMIELQQSDIVRHRLVQNIVDAYGRVDDDSQPRKDRR
jgi:phosphate starvation-inducible PhoH-like protein